MIEKQKILKYLTILSIRNFTFNSLFKYINKKFILQIIFKLF